MSEMLLALLQVLEHMKIDKAITIGKGEVT